MTDKIQIPVWVTPEQKAALDNYLGRRNRAGFIRDLIGDALAAEGVEWPDNMPKPGEKSASS